MVQLDLSLQGWSMDWVHVVVHGPEVHGLQGGPRLAPQGWFVYVPIDVRVPKGRGRRLADFKALKFLLLAILS